MGQYIKEKTFARKFQVGSTVILELRFMLVTTFINFGSEMFTPFYLTNKKNPSISLIRVAKTL